MDETLDFAFSKNSPSIIKVIGVGGGGGNAVSHMYEEGIQDVTFVLCNTDNQALRKSPIPHKIQLGEKITEGLGAGNRPERARQAAEESLDEIMALFNDGTKMVFITAGMGGGTGTGAAPVIARIAKQLDILTVGIVTIPFLFEGQRKIQQAIAGVEEMRKYVDALLVINNERLREIYPDLNFLNAFGKADDTLTMAAKSIAEIITVNGYINLDFADVNTILKDGGAAIMSFGFGEGENRVTQAIDDALNSPLLHRSDILGAKKVLLNLYFSENSQLKMEEINEVNRFMQRFNKEIEVIWGAAFDETLGEKVKITILATGIDLSGIAPTFVPEDAIETNNPADNIEKVATYYGEESIKEIDRAKARATYVILSDEQFDDDTVLEMIDKSPAYNRDPQFLAKLQKTGIAEELSEPTTSASKKEGTIKF